MILYFFYFFTAILYAKFLNETYLSAKRQFPVWRAKIKTTISILEAVAKGKKKEAERLKAMPKPLTYEQQDEKIIELQKKINDLKIERFELRKQMMRVSK